MATAKEIWDTLSKINVNEHTEKKGNLTYLSWAWAWGELMKHYPFSHYEFDLHKDAQGVKRDVLFYPDGSASVSCRVYVEGHSRPMSLPVMDNRNNAIQNPNARQISDTKMRCLVKCIAMFGLGHYIYAGEDLPEEAKKDLGPAPVEGDRMSEDTGQKKKSVYQLKKEGAWEKIVKEMNDCRNEAELTAWKNEEKSKGRFADWPDTYSKSLHDEYVKRIKDFRELAKEAAE